jgi:hypothetical protein
MVYHLPKAIINLHQGVSSYKNLSAISTMAYHLTKSYQLSPLWCIIFQKLLSISIRVYHLIKSCQLSPLCCIILQKPISHLHYGVSSYKKLSAISTMVCPLIKRDPSCKLPSISISPAVRTFCVINETSCFFSAHKHSSLARHHSVSRNIVFSILLSPHNTLL